MPAKAPKRTATNTLAGRPAAAGWASVGRCAALLRGANTNSEYDPGTFPSYLPADADHQGEHDEVLAGISAQFDAERWHHQIRLNHLSTENGDFAGGQRTLATEGERTKASYAAGYRFGSSLQAQGFVEYEEESFKQRAAASLFGDPNQNQRLDALSGGLELIGRFGTGFAWSASLRQDDNSDFGNATTHRLALRYRIGAGELWLNLGEGIKNPSFIERFGYTPDTFRRQSRLGAGDQQTPFDGREGLTFGPTTWALTLFRDRLKNEIDGFSFDPALGGFTALNRDGKSKRQGAEVSAEAQFGNTRLSAGWAYLDAEEDDGSGEIRRPRPYRAPRRHPPAGPLAAARRCLLRGQPRRLQLRLLARRPGGSRQLPTAALQRIVPAYRLAGTVRRLENGLDDDYEDVLGYRMPGRAAYFGARLSF